MSNQKCCLSYRYTNITNFGTRNLLNVVHIVSNEMFSTQKRLKYIIQTFTAVLAIVLFMCDCMHVVNRYEIHNVVDVWWKMSMLDFIDRFYGGLAVEVLGESTWIIILVLFFHFMLLEKFDWGFELEVGNVLNPMDFHVWRWCLGLLPIATSVVMANHLYVEWESHFPLLIVVLNKTKTKKK